MGLTDFLSYITPQTAVGIAICMTLAAWGLITERIVPGPRYRDALKKIDQLERKVSVWQRLFMVSNLATEKAASLPQIELELEECE